MDKSDLCNIFSIYFDTRHEKFKNQVTIELHISKIYNINSIIVSCQLPISDRC